MVIFIVRKPLFAFMAFLLASGPAPEPAAPDSAPVVAQSLPPLADSSWAFTDNGTLYLVGKTSGQVIKIRADNSSPNIEPEKPRPKPVPVDNFQPVAAFLFFDAQHLTVDQAAIKTDSSLKDAASRAGVPLFCAFADDPDFTGPTWQAAINRTGTPCMVLLDKANKPKTVKINSRADVLEALK